MSAELVLKSIAELKTQNEAARTKLEVENAELRKSLSDSTAKQVELQKSFETTKSEFDKLNGYLMQPDHDQNSPYKIFAQAKDKSLEARGGYRNLGQFCKDVRDAEVNHIVPQMLKSWMDKASASGLNELAGSEGAFLVPPDFNMEIWKRTYDNPLLKMTQAYNTSHNELNLHGVDETSRTNGSRFGGVQMYWESEAAAFTATKPAFNRINLRLKKLIGSCYVTDELLADAPAVQSLLTDVFAEEAKFKVGDSVINGSGAGQPLGVLNSSALVSVSKETGQAAATIVKENIDKMWSRMYAPCREKAVWLINQDIEPALESMALNVGTGGMPVYLPPGGISASPYAKLKGRDVIPVEFCSTLGTVGDVILVDLSQYVTLRRGDVATDTSIHFKFDTFQTTFRMFMRIDGAPRWLSALTPFKGSNSQSFAIALNTRS